MNTKISTALAALALSAFPVSPSLQAATISLFYDQNGATAGTGVSGTGATWDAGTLQNWRLTSSTGALQGWDNSTPTNNVQATFGGTAGTVTLAASTTINANLITFTTTGYTINGASGSKILLGGTTPAISVGSGLTATINAVLDGGSLTRSGTGTLTLGGANTYTGNTSINGGALNITTIGGTAGSTSSNLGAGTGSIFLGNGGNSAALVYTGAGETTDRAISIGGGTNDIIENDSTSGALNFSSTSSLSSGVTSSRTLTFQGTNGGAFGGVISNGSGVLGITKAQAGSWTLTAANTYSGPTSITGGTLYVNNTSGSGTGSGSVTVSAGTLAGKGIITAGLTSSTGVTIKAGATLASGGVQSATSGSVDGTHLTINNSYLAIGSSGGTANLTFDLGSGNTSGASFQSYGNPNTNTTYLSLTGSTSMNFVGATAITLVDLTNSNGVGSGTLALRYGTPYLLVQAGANHDYVNLVINTGTAANPVYSLSQFDDGVNGYVAGIYTGGLTNPGSSDIVGNFSTISINEFGSDGMTALTPGPTGAYANPFLYLDAGNLEVVPEPGTWALMLSGLACLILVQSRRRRN